jgi:hypothetical protein
LFCDTPAALKRNLGKVVLAVVSPEPRRVRAEIERLDGISSLVMTGDGVHVVVDEIGRREQFAEALKTNNIQFDEIRQVTPTIEDLFVDAVARDGGTAV